MTQNGLAARRARARIKRSATLGAAADPAGGGVDLEVLLPSRDAATLLLLCEQAAESSG